MPLRRNSDDKTFDFDEALRRLIYVALAGCGIVGIYAWGASPTHLAAVTVGLMSSGASLLLAGLIGFLFGVPHVRNIKRDLRHKSVKKPGGGDDTAAQESAASRYTPSTSLEQISDWLTKIIVGVGLIDFKEIVTQLDIVAARIQKDMGGSAGGNAFAFGLIIYFAICGFTFGFLWSRLYLAEWFRKADAVKALQGQVSQLMERQLADAKALSLILPQLTSDEGVQVSEKEISDAVHGASKPIREQIFERAKEASANFRDKSRITNFDAIIPVLKALVAVDPKGRDFEIRGELSFALSRKKPPDLNEAINWISEAIRLRDLNHHGGWRYYEVRRARYRIQIADKKRPMDSKTAESILADLRFAQRDKEKWARWVSEDDEVKTWLQENNLTPELQRVS